MEQLWQGPNRTRTIMCQIIAAVVGLIIAWHAVMLFDRSAVVELDSSASYITPNPANMGGAIAITWKAKSYRNCGGEVIPRIIDSTGRIFEYAKTPTVYNVLMRADPAKFTKLLTLPTIMTPGPARYEAVVIRWCNWVQKEFWPMVDKPFPILFEIPR